MLAGQSLDNPGSIEMVRDQPTPMTARGQALVEIDEVTRYPRHLIHPPLCITRHPPRLLVVYLLYVCSWSAACPTSDALVEHAMYWRYMLVWEGGSSTCRDTECSVCACP